MSGSATSTSKDLRTVWYARIVAAVLWALALVAAILDITDHFPRGLVFIAAVLAGTATVVAIQLANHAETAEAISALDGRVEQISAKVGTFWDGYTAGVHDVNGVKTLNAARGEGHQAPN